VSFTTAGGWATPTNATVSISDNLTTTASGTYIQSSPFTCAINNNNTLTIVGYTGAGGTVTIPAAFGGLPVSSIGNNAFNGQTTVTSVTMPNSVASIGSSAFTYCFGLTNVILSTNLTSIGDNAFFECYDLLNMTIPASVTSIGQLAFYDCTSMAGMYFQGNAPATGVGPFDLDTNLTVYYLPGTTGWSSTFGGVPAVLSRPALSITMAANNSAIISWPSFSTGFVLQQNSNPSTTNWTNSGFLINDNGTTRWVTNSSATGSLFFRLNNP
jgi:hypothetical protein